MHQPFVHLYLSICTVFGSEPVSTLRVLLCTGVKKFSTHVSVQGMLCTFVKEPSVPVSVQGVVCNGLQQPFVSVSVQGNCTGVDCTCLSV